ncbi:hypothetical protein FBUS_02611 [Fasciolopsis buskii]|uniref:Tetraspanin n=1 Tax=Fasciolopsis buskii TaxID=27845 RepID=A0A8E0RQ86_9TREM|nr:hypothetical protein FBUS_02611 [Fasciolopsis buski]
MCHYRGLQITLVVLNVLILLCGIFLAAFGGYGLFLIPKYSQGDDYHLRGLLVGFTVIGCLMFAISLFGIICAFTRNACLIMMYIIILSILVIGQTVCGFVATSRRSHIFNQIPLSLEKYVNGYYNTPEYENIVNSIQQDYRCCGLNGPSDYTSGKIPASCYRGGQLESKGCKTVLVNTTWSYMTGLFATAFAFLVVEVVAVLIAFLMMNAMDKEITTI